jgi:hypothetical protein
MLWLILAMKNNSFPLVITEKEVFAKIRKAH